jgi:hypothetical protein
MTGGGITTGDPSKMESMSDMSMTQVDEPATAATAFISLTAPA